MNNSGRLLPGQRPLNTQVCLRTSSLPSAVLQHLDLLFLLPFISLKPSTFSVPLLIILFVSLRLLLPHRFLFISICLLSLFHPTSLSLSLSPHLFCFQSLSSPPSHRSLRQVFRFKKKEKFNISCQSQMTNNRL